MEEKVCEWLQMNIEKSKKGSFVPISIKKLKIKKDVKSLTHLDFFVVSALHNFNNGLKQVKNHPTGID